MSFEELMIRMLANRAELQKRVDEEARPEVKEELKEKEGESILLLTLMDMGWVNLKERKTEWHVR